MDYILKGLLVAFLTIHFVTGSFIAAYGISYLGMVYWGIGLVISAVLVSNTLRYVGDVWEEHCKNNPKEDES